MLKIETRLETSLIFNNKEKTYNRLKKKSIGKNKMANAIITFEIMPTSPDVDLEPIKEKATKIVQEQGAKGNIESKVEPVAFGLKKIIIMGMYEVSDDKDFDLIPQEMMKIEGVQQAEVANMDLAMG